MSFIDFAEVKARCSIEQAGKLLDLKTTEECSQLRAPSPVCGGGPRAIVITPAKNLFHCFPSKAGGDQIALVSHVKSVSQKGRRGLDARAISARYVQDGKVTSTGTSTVPPHDHFPPLDYLKFDHVTVESLGIASDIAEALGIGYAPRAR
jgi:hypothetical protein